MAAAIRFEARGSTPAELLQDVALRLFASLAAGAPRGEILREKLLLEPSPLPELLAAWLRALLRLVVEEHMIFGRVRVGTAPPRAGIPPAWEAELTGELLDRARPGIPAGLAQAAVRATLLAERVGDYRAAVEIEAGP